MKRRQICGGLIAAVCVGCLFASRPSAARNNVRPAGEAPVYDD